MFYYLIFLSFSNVKGIINKQFFEYNPYVLSFSILIQKSIFQNMYSISNGGGLLIDNNLYSVELSFLLFNNCSADSIGGGFYIKCKTFIF